MSNYQRNQSGLTPNTEAGGRRGQLASRNASTYNPISFDPHAQANIEEDERIQKKNKQAAYREQLNQMTSNNRDQRNAADDNMQRAQKEAEYAQEIERREAEQRYLDQNENQRRSDEEAYLQEQYKKMTEYERYQQQMDEMEKNYKLGANQNRNEDYGRPIQETKQPQIQHPEANRTPQKNQEADSTFNQQDDQRELLLNKIKSGYNQPNNYVWNSYQRAHDEREKNKQEFERNIINKAAQDRQREEVRAMSDWEKKKRMQQEAADANRRAAESRMLEKKRSKLEDTMVENQRNQDSLSQFEREGFRQKENQKRLKEEASRVLEQQIRESNTRKLNKEENVTLFAHPLKGNADAYQRNYYEKEQTNPLQSSNAKINQASMSGKQVEALDHLSSQMDQLSMKANYHREEDYGQGYPQSQYQQQQYGGQLANQNKYQDSQIKSGHENPGNRGPYAREDDYGQGHKQYSQQQQQQQYQYSGDLGNQNNYQEAQTRSNLAHLSEYQKNRLKNRNTGYNIITNNNR